MKELNQSQQEELALLANEFVEGSLSMERSEHLSELLEDRPEAQIWFRDWMLVHAILHLDFYEGQQELLSSLATSNRSEDLRKALGESQNGSQTSNTTRQADPLLITASTLKKYSLSAVLVGTLASSVFLAGFFFRGSGSSQNDRRLGEQASRIEQNDSIQAGRQVASHDPFSLHEGTTLAMLTQAKDAKWSDQKNSTNVGTALVARKYYLKSGVVRIEFLSGASMIVESPSEFELISSSKARFFRGKFRAYVPYQARGFTVDTPTHRVIDLGTEFAVSVDASGASEFHVLDGEIELHKNPYDKNRSLETDLVSRLTGGLGARSSLDGGLTEMPANGDAFMDDERLLNLTRAGQHARYVNWAKHVEQTKADPGVLVYYDFENHQPWSRTLRDDSAGRSAPISGAIIGCQWTSGRWPEKRALEFKRTSDRVRVNVPGEFESLSFIAWVRIEGFDRWLSSLMLTDGHEKGEPHWQITDKGNLLLGVNASGDLSQEYLSPPLLGPEDLGNWIQLACVYDGPGNFVKHYVDGVLRSEHEITVPCSLRIGPAEIGNWAPSFQKVYLIRSFNGRMDEFAIYGRALDDVDIRAIYEIGKPYE